MRENETEIEMVRRHVEEGAKHIARQRLLVARLRQEGLPTQEAANLLATFEAIQRQHEDHLARATTERG